MLGREQHAGLNVALVGRNREPEHGQRVEGVRGRARRTGRAVWADSVEEQAARVGPQGP